jgi:molybdenum-dependent DNA-binding transcriptional regulator ModE
MNLKAELDRAAHRIHVAERTVPYVLDALNDRAADYSTSSSRGRNGGGHADPTSRQAAHLADIDHHRQLIAQAVQLIHAAIDHIDLTCRQALGGHLASAEDAPRCPGHPAGGTCGDLTTYTLDTRHGPILRTDRLCDRCARELEADERRERRARNERIRYTARQTAP